ncbi:MAG: hypothetical protein MZU84_05990 [Sphingobacterium sp.]|nr:hypothetical protein [Sphingobacterium sp.]
MPARLFIWDSGSTTTTATTRAPSGAARRSSGNRTSLSANLGGQGGLGFDYRVARRWCVFVEAQGRYARFGKLRERHHPGGLGRRRLPNEGRKIYLPLPDPGHGSARRLQYLRGRRRTPVPDPPDLVISEPRNSI